MLNLCSSHIDVFLQFQHAVLDTPCFSNTPWLLDSLRNLNRLCSDELVAIISKLGTALEQTRFSNKSHRFTISLHKHITSVPSRLWNFLPSRLPCYTLFPAFLIFYWLTYFNAFIHFQLVIFSRKFLTRFKHNKYISRNTWV